MPYKVPHTPGRVAETRHRVAEVQARLQLLEHERAERAHEVERLRRARMIDLCIASDGARDAAVSRNRAIGRNLDG
jgi:hypothetical protein